ncbi:hypothetical protein ACFQ36_15065 [Arthrobacter sp. GCM10027362]|uniref:hypothetical protein n=1 Tax=Arthrobacter sp. GCM10027362 TaxID=3273379 RepID=UPI00362ED873
MDNQHPTESAKEQAARKARRQYRQRADRALVEHGVSAILKVRQSVIADHMRNHRITKPVTYAEAMRWQAGEAPAPVWMAELIDHVRGRREEMDGVFKQVRQKLLNGSRIGGRLEETAATDLAFRAARDLCFSGGSVTWLNDLDLAALAWAGIDPGDTESWPFEIPQGLMPTRGLAEKLTAPLGPDLEHIITVAIDGQVSGSSAVRVRGDLSCDIELPGLMSGLERAVAAGASGGIVLRSIDDSRTYPVRPGLGIPYTIVRGWFFHDRLFEARTGAEIFSFMCTNVETGEAIDPDPTVDCEGSWDFRLP